MCKSDLRAHLDGVVGVEPREVEGAVDGADGVALAELDARNGRTPACVGGCVGGAVRPRRRGGPHTNGAGGGRERSPVAEDAGAGGASDGDGELEDLDAGERATASCHRERQALGAGAAARSTRA